MHLDIQTLAVVTILTSTITGLLLVLSWLQSRDMTALAVWGIAFLLGAAATTLLFARGRIPDAVSIVVANALLSTAYGAMWNAARVFDARPISRYNALAGAWIWLIANQFDAFYASSTARVGLSCMINGTYSFLTAFELWRGRSEPLASRWPAIIFLLLHTSVLIARVPLLFWFPIPADNQFFQWTWARISTLDGLCFVITVSFSVAMMAKERVQLYFHNAAQTDPLTGVLNRRAFLAVGETLLSQRLAAGLPTAAIMFDLDDFKQINDKYGHLAGDAVLRKFCAAATAKLGTDSVFGRLGGEEFGGLLAATSLDSAVQIAEDVRRTFENTQIKFGLMTFSGTVSVGAAISGHNRTNLSTLLGAADRLLYRAKARGRNRTEWDYRAESEIAGTCTAFAQG